jgi:hypothetical protein
MGPDWPKLSAVFGAGALRLNARAPLIEKDDSMHRESALVGVLVCGVIVICVAGTALAGETTRDHRGPDGAPQGGVTVNGQSTQVGSPGQLGCPKCKGGFGSLSGDGDSSGKGSGDTGVTVRDHRND